MASVRRIPVALGLVHKPGTRLQLGVRKLGSVTDRKHSFTMYDLFLVGPHYKHGDDAKFRSYALRV
jgi:hypothetical protein